MIICPSGSDHVPTRLASDHRQTAGGLSCPSNASWVHRERRRVSALSLALGLATALALPGVARAQPVGGTPGPDAPPPSGAPRPEEAPPPHDDTVPPENGATPTDATTAQPTAGDKPLADHGDETPATPTEPQGPRKRRDHAIPDLPQVLTAPTGRILPAAYIYSRSSVDTGGGLASELRVGLGDVGEFGVATTDLVRARRGTDTPPERIAPYLLASFRLGVKENQFFKHQPAASIGFRKSFEAKKLGASSRVAELNVVMSKRFAEVVAVHAGITFWDASLNDGTGETTFHEEAQIKDQLRPVLGIEFRPKSDAEILIDYSYAPSFCYSACTEKRFRLDPILSWGVRYLVADWIHIEAGVRVQDIREINLLDAQIFGQFTLITDRLQRVINRLGGPD